LILTDKRTEGGIFLKKGFLVLITVTAMLICQCGAALGNTGAALGDASIYLEGSLLTQNDLNSTTETENDWASAVLGIDASVGRCKVTTESYAKTVEGNNIKSNNTKVSFAIIDGNFIRLDATLSYQELKIKDSSDPFGSDIRDCNGYLFGLDLRIDLSERIVWEAAIGYTNGGTCETSTTDSDASILTYKLKCDWMPWRNFGFSVGYRYYSYRPDSVANAENNFSGMYGGLVWRFNNIHLNSSDRAPLQIWGKQR
jgi:hypothetical protein